jgi:hypothetical protein
MSRLLITVGAILIAAGLLIQFGVPIGRLPGDITIRRGQGTFYFPIVTCLVISVIVSLVGWLFRR